MLINANVESVEILLKANIDMISYGVNVAKFTLTAVKITFGVVLMILMTL